MIKAGWFLVFLLAGIAAQGQSADPDGRATPAQRAAAGVGAPVAELPAAASLSKAEQMARLKGWRAEVRRRLFVPERMPELEGRVWSTFSPVTGVIADRVTYATADGMMVTGIVYRPDPAGMRLPKKMPGIVIVNGHGGDKASWYAFYSGMLFAKAGAVVLTYDPIGEGERSAVRNAKPGAHDAWVSPPAGLPRTDWGQRLAGLMQVDLLQGVRYLASQPEVDASRIAAAGYSMGAFVAGLTGAIAGPDTPIRALLLSGGGVYDGPGGYFDSNPLPCQMPPYRALLPLGDRGAVLFALNAERGATLIQNGSEDGVMDIQHHPPAWFAEERRRAETLIPLGSAAQKNLFTTIVYPGIGHRPSWLDRQGVAWLNEELQFPLWTAAEIAAAPLTRVSVWAAANGVTVAPNYTRDDREGGIQVPGPTLPGLSRTELTVMPDADWKLLQPRLSYEAWAEKTKAAEEVAARSLTQPAR